MYRELFVATLTAAVWLTLCFLLFGMLYGLAGTVIGPARLMMWEASLGQVRLPYGVTISRISVWLYGLAVFAAVLPVNFYWLRRLHRPQR